MDNLIHNKYVQFISIFILFICVNVYYITDDFYYDVRKHIKLSNEFGNGYSFTPFKYFSYYKGYFFPFIINILFRITVLFHTKLFTTYIVFSAAITSLFNTIIMPKIFFKTLNLSFTPTKILLFVLMQIIFWGGYFVQPLGDIFAAYMLLLAILLLFADMKYSLIIAGFFIAVAINIRPSYQLCFYAFVIYLVVDFLKSKKAKKIIRFGIGASIVLLPQFALNVVSMKVITPFVYVNSKPYNGASSVLLYHLSDGLKFVKYETSIDEKRTNPQMFYGVSESFKVIEAEKKFKSVGEWLTVVQQNFVAVTTIYSLHLFNALNQTHNQLYITNSFENGYILSLLNWLVISIAVIVLIINFEKIKSRKAFLFSAICLFLIIAPVAPTIVETRFLLPIHFLFYFAFVFFSYKQFVQKSFKFKILSVAFVTSILILSVFLNEYNFRLLL